VGVALTFLFLAPTMADASFDNLVVVAQPMEDDGGIQLCYTTYILDMGNAWPGAEVHFTCSRAALLRPAYSRDYPDSLEVEDGNAARKAGITIDVEDRYDPGTWNSASSIPPGAREGNHMGGGDDVYVDTLAVDLDTQAAFDKLPAGRVYLQELDEIVGVTIDCIRDNASRSAVPIRHVKLVVTGPERYRMLSGLLSIKPGVRTVH
jgi:hypothetical protein